MPFGYLEFSCAIRGKPCPRRRSWAGSGSGSLPGPVLFEPGLTGMGYRRSYPLRHPDPNPNQRNGSQQTVANSCAVAAVVV